MKIDQDLLEQTRRRTTRVSFTVSPIVPVESPAQFKIVRNATIRGHSHFTVGAFVSRYNLPLRLEEFSKERILH